MQLDSVTNNLIVRAKMDNNVALNELFARYQSRVLRIVRHRLTGDQRNKLKLQSMDILQEVFIYAFQHLKDFEPKSQGHFLNWLSNKVKHLICDRIDYLSRKKRTAVGGEISMDQEVSQVDEAKEVKIQIKDSSPTPSQFAVNKEREELIDSMLDLLEHDEREIIIHRNLEELSFPEIGELLGKSEEAARKQYCRAFKKLIDLAEEKIQPIMAEETYRKYSHEF